MSKNLAPGYTGIIYKDIPEFTVTCHGCDKFAAGRHMRQQYMEDQLRKDGWHTIHGKWMCQECVNLVLYERQNLRNL